MLGYTRRQLVLLLVIAVVGAAGVGIDRWRRANPDVVAYLETIDRAPRPGLGEAVARRTPAPAREASRASTAAPGSVPTEREPARARRARAPDAAPTDVPIDVNLASAAELARLPGVGPALAARIVDTRARDGPFASIDDLRRVRGVGAATLERLRPRLAVRTP